MSEVLYGLDGYGNLPSSLYRINVGSGLATLIGPTGFSNVTALAYDTTSTTMYAIVSSTITPFSGILLTVNLTTGVATSVAAVVSTPAGINITISDACFVGGTLYGWNQGGNGSTFPGDNIATINKVTGTLTQTTTAAFITPPETGIARNPVSGTLFVKGAQTFVRAFQTTGTTAFFSIITVGVSTGLEAGFTFNDTGVAYVIDRHGGGTDLLTVNPLTAGTCAAQVVGPTGVATLDSIEFGPPVSAAIVHTLTGLYELVPGRTNDLVYSTISVQGTVYTPTTESRKIPEPSATLYGVGDE